MCEKGIKNINNNINYNCNNISSDLFNSIYVGKTKENIYK